MTLEEVKACRVEMGSECVKHREHEQSLRGESAGHAGGSVERRASLHQRVGS